MTVPPPSALGQRPRPPWVGLEPPCCDSGRGDALSKVCGGVRGEASRWRITEGGNSPGRPKGKEPREQAERQKAWGQRLEWVPGVLGGPQAQAPRGGELEGAEGGRGLCPGRAGVGGQT